jgi:hypothetical protein
MCYSVNLGKFRGVWVSYFVPSAAKKQGMIRALAGTICLLFIVMSKTLKKRTTKFDIASMAEPKYCYSCGRCLDWSDCE